ncbi:BnaC05g49880D [Brassica napus]|uniref:(rape) hypothetical protein n=1 Tax=Brassica napus TaxID=3708 RepID=A0A078JBF8_BRANA|nr:unnamed protein product [Brassica napus]CDY61378.1 BnaC05g49880D [Brassica napus]
MLPLSLSYISGSSSLILDPSHPGRASVTAMVSSRHGKLARTSRSIRVYSPVCYLVERFVLGLKVQSRILQFFSFVRTLSQRPL